MGNVVHTTGKMHSMVNQVTNVYSTDVASFQIPSFGHLLSVKKQVPIELPTVSWVGHP